MKTSTETTDLPSLRLVWVPETDEGGISIASSPSQLLLIVMPASPSWLSALHEALHEAVYIHRVKNKLA